MSESVAKRGSKIGGPEDWLGLLGAAGLKERILFTVAMIVLYRVGVHIPIPGVNPGAFTEHPELAQNLLGMIDLFTGGALNKLSVFSMGIGPYITASIVMQLMTVVIPKLENMQKEQGEQGRRQLAQVTRLVTVGLAVFQSFMLAQLLSRIPGVVITPGPLFLCTTTLILSACAMFIMWMGELITERGVGNGASLLIFLGIAARLPVMVKNTYETVQTGQTQLFGVLALTAFFLLVVAFIVRLQQGVRKVMVLGSRRNVGRQIFAAPDDYMYLPVNPSGVMAIIFASSLLMFPSTIMQFLQKQNQGDPGMVVYDAIKNLPSIGPAFVEFAKITWVKDSWAFIAQEFNNCLSYYAWEHSVLYFSLILFFAFFYSSIVLPVRDMSDNLRRSGRAIQHVRPGRPTTEFLEKTLNRLTFIGATSVAFIAIAPIHVEQATMVTTLQGLGSTSLIILVGVAIDTQRQILTHALSARYQARGLFKTYDKKEL
ncbi:MAG: preprotein translocase subunit SecY [Candidatus Obscuribacter phosphatis]|uniref:Protein translocase subunit SecY n=1 Tax=Candidatus Obscuribacter phosphatis TaxID=1906157 RepID=A0A8J7P7F6_9BACT|nr:preprotein translocase subunit SecY [Candidatus Obscuribacter phosphatis]